MTAPRLSEFIKAYDVRGLVPEQLNSEVAFAIGSAFAQVVAHPDGATSIVIGHDMRPSSPELSRAFADGAASQGLDVTLIGLCSTDGLYYASGALNVPGAMFTASHNPAKYNGIKLCRSGARPVGQDTGLGQVSDLAQSLLDSGEVRGASTVEASTGTITEQDVLADYATFLRGLVDLREIRPLIVVVDAGNGMGGHTVPAVLGTGGGLPALPLTVIPLYFELDGTFPNHEANPLDPENLRDLQAAVIAQGADLGLAFDGDADRCFVVDERGEPVSPSAITALVATREIAKERAAGRPTATIVYNVISSAAVPEIIAEAGGTGVRTRVGHSFIKGEMAPSSRARWLATRRSSAASTRLTTTSATSGSPTPGCSPRCTSWPRWGSSRAPSPRWSRDSPGMPRPGRSTRQSPMRAPPPRRCARGQRPRPRLRLRLRPVRARGRVRARGTTKRLWSSTSWTA